MNLRTRGAAQASGAAKVTKSPAGVKAGRPRVNNQLPELELTIAPLSTVNYAFCNCALEPALLDRMRASILSEYDTAGAHGQGVHFPVFTENYLAQSTK